MLGILLQLLPIFSAGHMTFDQSGFSKKRALNHLKHT